MVQTRELCSSANRDRWFLARDPGSGRVFIEHEADASSGGHKADIAIGVFLNRDAHGPEHGKLLCLIGTLVEDTPPAVQWLIGG